MTSLRDVVDLLHGWYPPATAEPWDRVGLVWGDLDQPVRRVLLAVDPAPEVAREAVDDEADLLLVHHPLLLRGVHGITTETPKGRTLTTLARGGCALLTAHTNADQAVGGVSEALALALGLTGLRPIVPSPPAEPVDKLTVMVPVPAADRLREALAAAGAGRIGGYDAASFSVAGQGRFRPLAGADPAIGEVGAHEVVAEERIEVVVPRGRRAAVVRALLAVHPYEEPAFDVVALEPVEPAVAGTGRVGEVEPTTLRGFAERVAAALPATAGGVRIGGDPERPVRRVALCGGAGDSLLDTVAGLDVDVYLTSDLRHHPAAEFLERGGPALLDVAHWAAEWTWLPVAAARLEAALAARGATVSTRVSMLRTDPWTARV